MNPEFIGAWKLRNINYIKYLEINTNSEGNIVYYDGVGNFESVTQTRKWLTKDDYLYFGQLGSDDPIGDDKMDEKFKIDLNPTVSNSTIYTGYDTVFTGDIYIILDGKYYTKE